MIKEQATRRSTKAGQILALLAACLALSACNWMYFHDDEYEKQAKLTVDAVKTLDASKDIQVGSQRIDELQQRYEVQYADEQLAQRGIDVALVLKGNNALLAATLPAATPRGGMAYLDHAVRNRIEDVAGISPVKDISTDDLALWIDTPRKLNVFEREYERQGGAIQNWRQKYLAEEGIPKNRKLDCLSLLKEFPHEPGPEVNDPGLKYLQAVWEGCRGRLDYAELALQKFPSEVGAYIDLKLQEGTAPAKNASPCGERYDDVMSDVLNLLQRAAGVPGESEIARLSGAWARELNAASQADACKALVSSQLAKLSKAAGKGGSDAKATEIIGTLKDILSGASSIIKLDALAEMSDILDELAKVDIENLADAARDTATSEQEVSCGSDAGIAQPTVQDNAQPKLDGCMVTAVLSVLKGTVASGRAFLEKGAKERLEETTKELYALRRQLALITIEAKERQAIRDLTEQQLLAAVTEMANLAGAAVSLKEVSKGNPLSTKAVLAIQDPDTRELASQALASYSQSWSAGRIPFSILQTRPEWVRHKSEIERDAALAQWNKQLIDDALGAVHAYAQGGIDIKVLMEFLIGSGLIAAVAL